MLQQATASFRTLRLYLRRRVECETEPACGPERCPSAPMSRSTQWRKSTNSDDNQYINVNCEVLQLLPKELEEHKAINNKDGIEHSLHGGCRHRLHHGRQTDAQRHPDVPNQHTKRRRAILDFEVILQFRSRLISLFL